MITCIYIGLYIYIYIYIYIYMHIQSGGNEIQIIVAYYQVYSKYGNASSCSLSVLSL